MSLEILKVMIIISTLTNLITITTLIALTWLTAKLYKKVEVLEDLLTEILKTQCELQNLTKTQNKEPQEQKPNIIELLKFYGKNFL